ncbi:MAG: alpha-galactosidase [Phycisphaerae bacterium]|nr:alpha-galactosidase [Phycisphaerae bacterium]
MILTDRAHIHLLLTAVLLASTAAAPAEPVPDPIQSDWLVNAPPRPATVQRRAERNEVVLDNGLLRRAFRTAPNFATIEFRNLTTDETFLRGVKPEAVVVLDGQRYEIGGLKGQPDYAYLDPAWLQGMTANPKAFQFVSYDVGKPETPYPWKPKRHSGNIPWPPRGVALTVHFAPHAAAPDAHKHVTVSVRYELYDGIPVISKQIAVTNGGAAQVIVNAVQAEILAVTEQAKPRLHAESDYAFAGVQTTRWGPDPDYKTQIDYSYNMPLLMTSTYPEGPGIQLAPGERFESFRTVELLHDSDDRERRGLARRRLYRTLAPAAMENPILMHVRQSDSKAIRLAVDQCAAVGFEMVIATFWSGFNIESEDPAYIARFKADVDYAHAKGVELGGYTLMCASRDVGPKYNCISPATSKPGSKFGQSACLASAWRDAYFHRVLAFMDATGMDVIETDGPYHGDVCASTQHQYHRGLADSRCQQWRACVGFYRECRKRGIYINTPDWYYLGGSNKCAMGYRETNFSLPRWRQILISRQNIYDGTFEKTPSMGWMFVPLVQYHGGGAEATFEPLSQHLAEYEWHLAQNFGSGVQACYRGPRLYDTDETKAVVKKWVDFYKKHRAILDSDIIHVRRADGRGIDCMMHVNPRLPRKALAMVYNPTDSARSTILTLPLYYTGLTTKAKIREKEGDPVEYALDRAYKVCLPATIPPKSITWYVVE